MRLVEIKGLFEMDAGAPSPLIISNDTELVVCFYVDNEVMTDLSERNTGYEIGVVVIKFKGYLYYNFGLPGNETLRGHPYYKLGIKSFGFYELLDSDLINKLKQIEKVHPYYNAAKWDGFRHFILTFHDNMFECVSSEFDVIREEMSVYNKAYSVLSSIATKHL
ncbi:hypothetical protein [Pararcticibacter amylolyticus]|uniref:Uncharacterized protein n=1 Tax=Pararcticibacter amylolyticus TaxID=2173175 RepID=A0A2U2PA19_9SPHI|nr:hypothetical protein [Pararcticibacter amylolyticus]PWG78231.1 hypothetical protein DDR33_23250 [Pararcticibacter amylolyticus]